MSTTKDRIKNTQRSWATGELRDDDPGKELPQFVTPHHIAWLQRHSRQRTYSPEAIEFALAELRGEHYAPREPGTTRFSPSSIAEKCGRRALFSYAGAPKAPDSPSSIDLMDGGSWLHLKWQLEGLSAPWLAEAELWKEVTYRGRRLIAKIDGRCIDGSIFELKTRGDYNFKEVTKAPVWSHLMQFVAYCMVFDIDVGSLVYLDRGSQAFWEHRLRASDTLIAQFDALIDDLGYWIDVDELPDMLEGCQKVARGQTATQSEVRVYRQCPYRENCPAAGKVSTVGELRR